jgi:hypothetical protein
MTKHKLSKKAVEDSLKEALGPNSPAVDMIMKDSEKRNRHHRVKADKLQPGTHSGDH